MRAYEPAVLCRALRLCRANSGKTAANAGEASKRPSAGAMNNMTALSDGKCKIQLKIVPAI